MAIRTVKCSTRKNKAAAAVTTALTLNYDGIEITAKGVEALLPVFEDGLVIARQAQYRRMEGAIPTTDTIKVLEFVTALAKRQGVPEPVTVDSLLQKQATMSEADQIKFFQLVAEKQKAFEAARNASQNPPKK